MVEEFIAKYSSGVVVYLGCGLDTRITRINPPASVSWFDMDYPEVIALRKTFYSDREGYSMIASSVTDPGWLSRIPSERQTLIIAEGLLEYLAEEEIRTLFNRLTDHFHHGQIMFDVMSSFAINAGKKKLKETTGAVHKWAVDEVSNVDKLNPRFKRIEALPLFKSAFMSRLPFTLRLLLGFASFFTIYKNMMRLMLFRF